MGWQRDGEQLYLEGRLLPSWRQEWKDMKRFLSDDPKQVTSTHPFPKHKHRTNEHMSSSKGERRVLEKRGETEGFPSPGKWSGVTKANKRSFETLLSRPIFLTPHISDEVIVLAKCCWNSTEVTQACSSHPQTSPTQTQPYVIHDVQFCHM